jgi:hypothetical protein
VITTSEGLSLTLPVRVHEADGSEPIPTPDNFHYPWSWSGLQQISVTGSSAADSSIALGPTLETHSRISQASLHPDDAVSGARSVQFANGTVYVEGGRIWLADRSGRLVVGPR